MRPNMYVFILVLAALLALTGTAFAQTEPPPERADLYRSAAAGCKARSPTYG